MIIGAMIYQTVDEVFCALFLADYRMKGLALYTFSLGPMYKLLLLQRGQFRVLMEVNGVNPYRRQSVTALLVRWKKHVERIFSRLVKLLTELTVQTSVK